jgi:hypothetical protein
MQACARSTAFRSLRPFRTPHTLAAAHLHSTTSCASESKATSETSAPESPSNTTPLSEAVSHPQQLETSQSTTIEVSAGSARKRTRRKSPPDDGLSSQPSGGTTRGRSQLKTANDRPDARPQTNPFEAAERLMDRISPDTQRLMAHTNPIQHSPVFNPSLDDLEKFRRPPPTTHNLKHYEEEYDAMIDRELGRAFTREQLRKLAQEYQLDPRLLGRKATKESIAGAILEKKWGWPSPAELRRDLRERTEVVRKRENSAEIITSILTFTQTFLSRLMSFSMFLAKVASVLAPHRIHV